MNSVQWRTTWWSDSILLVVRLCLIMTCCMVMTVCGCSYGPDYPNTTISGMVTIDGKPVPKGYITFSPTKQGQGPVAGCEITMGKYCCELVPLGQHRVTFVAQSEKMNTITEVATGNQHEVPINLLPPRYSSGLDAEVDADESLLDFPLTTKP